MKLLSKRQVNAFIKKHDQWRLNNKVTILSRKIKLGCYLDGLLILAKVVVYAELLNHHPDMTLKYDSLEIKLTTHEAKGITKLDTDLADKIDELVY